MTRRKRYQIGPTSRAANESCMRAVGSEETHMTEPSNDRPCPECGNYETQPTGKPDDEGQVEFRCADCGEYFVDKTRVGTH